MRATWRVVLPAAAAVLLAVAAVLLSARVVPLPGGILDRTAITSVRILDREGGLLREALSARQGRHRFVPLAATSPVLVKATLRAEDARFLWHAGIDPVAVVRAAWADLRAGSVKEGGSTITQQLARMLRGGRRTLGNKMAEAFLALQIEARLDKTSILEEYLNRAPYGSLCFGAEAASRFYFGKAAADLSLAEAAFLAGLPAAPTALDPRRRLHLALARQRRILRRMAESGDIAKAAYGRALSEPVSPRMEAPPFAAPHLAQSLLQAFPPGTAASVSTTIDPALQARVEGIVRSRVAALLPRGVTNAAVVVLDAPTGDVLALVGSADFSDEARSGQVDGTSARRQPGSTLKPFTYALALTRGMTPATLLPDLPLVFEGADGAYCPEDYDGRFRGPVRLRVALASSLNVPAVHTLSRLGVSDLLALLRSLGFSSLDLPADHYGLGLTLGNGEVTLREMAEAYAVLARGGVHRPSRLLLSVRDAADRAVALPDAGRQRRLIPEEAAFLVTEILADPASRVSTFGRGGTLELPFRAAVKTGTSKDFRDNWTVGYTPDRVVAVWAGNFDGLPMEGVTGVTGAAPMWHDAMLAAHGEVAPRDFRPPPSIAEADICPLSGMLAGPDCGAPLREMFVRGTVPREHCDMHVADWHDPATGAPAASGAAGAVRRVVVRYPPEYQDWARRSGLLETR